MVANHPQRTLLRMCLFLALIALPAVASAEDTPLLVATRWIDALRAKDVKQLATLTTYPFALRDTGTTKGCRGGAAKDEASLEGALSCPLKDAGTQRALQVNSEVSAEPLEEKDLPPWSKKFKKDLKGSAILVDLPDDGVLITFIVVVDKDRVRTVVRHAEFDAN